MCYKNDSKNTFTLRPGKQPDINLKVEFFRNFYYE